MLHPVSFSVPRSVKTSVTRRSNHWPDFPIPLFGNQSAKSWFFSLAQIVTALLCTTMVCENISSEQKLRSQNETIKNLATTRDRLETVTKKLLTSKYKVLKEDLKRYFETRKKLYPFETQKNKQAFNKALENRREGIEKVLRNHFPELINLSVTWDMTADSRWEDAKRNTRGEWVSVYYAVVYQGESYTIATEKFATFEEADYPDTIYHQNVSYHDVDFSDWIIAAATPK